MKWIGLFACILLCSPVLAIRIVEDSSHDFSPIDPKVNPRLVAKRRYELELRRAGGPRPEVVQAILGSASLDLSLSNESFAACEHRLVDCDRLLEETIQAGQHDMAHQSWYLARVSAIREEARLQSLGGRRRHELYERAISTGSAAAEDVSLSNFDATRRAWEEGFHDLFATVRLAISKWRSIDRLAATPYIEVEAAVTSADPSRALVSLVRASAESEIDGLLNPSRVVTSADETRRGTAKLALRELRRLKLGAAIAGLKEILDLYRPVSEKYQKLVSDIRESGRQPLNSEIPAPTAHFGFVGWEIAEAVGDLGDRDFERKTLGGRTLWDQVNEAERGMVREGKLRQSEMASR